MRSNNKQLRLAAVVSHSPFKLPRGWTVRKILRRDGSHYDRYYYEPGTGKQFRSLREVERYLNGDGYPYKRDRRFHRGHGGSNLAIVACGMKHFTLPDGWFVDEVPRRSNPQWMDKYYYELDTGRKFRSMIAVQRYLAEKEFENAPLSHTIEEIKENKPLAKVFRLENRYNDCTPKKKNIERESKQESSFVDPPMKVNWVLASQKGDTWNPFISEMLVPDCVKEQWTSRFMIFMNDGIGNCRSSCT